MRKAYVEGINGSIEVTDKYVYFIIGKKNSYSKKGNLIWFEEIEDVTYKKPTTASSSLSSR